MLKEELLSDLKEAMKEKDTVRKNTIQLIRAAILQVEKDNAIELNDEKIVEIIAKESKKRKDAAIEFEKSGREDLINQNKEEIEVLAQYLPKQLTKEEIKVIVSQIISSVNATSIKDMGNVMKKSKEEIGVAADGKTISEVVKELLS